MHADVQPLFVFYVDLGITLKFFRFRYLRLAIQAGRSKSGLPVDKIITRSRGYALGELTTVIGHQFPARVFFSLRADRDLYTIQRPVIWSVGGTKDQSIWFLRFVLALFFSCFGLV